MRVKCLYGYTPFACDNRQDTKRKIIYHDRTLVFSRESSHERSISRSALDLMQKLITDKQVRLSSEKYLLNDHLEARRVSRPFTRPQTDGSAVENSMSAFVYKDDAEDIKKHSFFQNIAWESLHVSKPPFVPRVKGWEDTRYFDEEEPVSDVEDGSSSDSDQDHLSTIQRQEQAIAAASGLPSPPPSPQKPREANEGLATEKSKTKREKKRARDIALRDQSVKKKVMEIRKRGAFLGYTYRRPKAIRADTSDGYESHAVAKRSSGLHGIFSSLTDDTSSRYSS